MAKLTGLTRPAPNWDREQWLNELRELRRQSSTGRPGVTSDEILDEDRADRT